LTKAVVAKEGLLSGRVQRREKRFFAYVTLDSGEEVVAHCTNTGAMTSCWQPGDAVLLERSPTPGRKLLYTWLACRRGRTWVGVETGMANRVVAAAARNGGLPGLPQLRDVETEVAYGKENSRIDVHARTAGGQRVFVEVKNTTLKEGRTALFPDAVTERGQKHLRELAKVARAGHLAAMVFFVHRADVQGFDVAREVDPDYARELEKAMRAGVKVLPLKVRLGVKRGEGGWRLSWRLDGLHPLRLG